MLGFSTEKDICKEFILDGKRQDAQWLKDRENEPQFIQTVFHGGAGALMMQNVYQPNFFEAKTTTWLGTFFNSLAETGFENEAWDLAHKRIFSRYGRQEILQVATALAASDPLRAWKFINEVSERFTKDDMEGFAAVCAHKDKKEEQLAVLNAREDTKNVPLVKMSADWHNHLFFSHINPRLTVIIEGSAQSSQIEKNKDAFIEQIKKLNTLEQFFALNSIIHYGGINKNLWNGLKTGNFNVHLYKKFSEIELVRSPLLKKDSGVLLKHTMLTRAADTWKTVADQGIPVAPILKFGKNNGKATEVYSRFCGYSMDFYDYFLDQEAFVKSGTIWEMFEKRNQVLIQIKNQKDSYLLHGHPHSRNFTVEYIEKDYFKEFENVNEIPWNEEKIIFDPVEYLQNKDKYEMVVRLIDWDMADTLPKHQ